MKTLVNVLAACCVFLAGSAALASDAPLKTVAQVYQEKTGLAGKSVSVQGKVVKVNNGIMGRNFVHVQDGTGDASSNNLIVTSKDTAPVGQAVRVTGKVTLDRDFGAGYMYPLLLEEASIAAAK
jgi:starvation-inducible outer membrane lipoprotein